MDIDFSDAGNDYGCIRDDTYHQKFSQADPGARIDAIFDTCYSGTVTRIIQTQLGKTDDKINQVVRRRFIPPPIEWRLAMHSVVPSQMEKARIGFASVVQKAQQPSGASVVTTQNNALWSACQEYQLSEESEDESGQVRGFFTRVFAKIIRRSMGNMSRLDMYTLARQTMADQQMDQVPSLETPNKEALSLFPFRKANRDEPGEINKKTLDKLSAI